MCHFLIVYFSLISMIPYFETMTMSDIIIEDVCDHGSCGVLPYSDKVVAEGFMKYVS